MVVADESHYQHHAWTSRDHPAPDHPPDRINQWLSQAMDHNLGAGHVRTCWRCANWAMRGGHPLLDGQYAVQPGVHRECDWDCALNIVLILGSLGCEPECGAAVIARVAGRKLATKELERVATAELAADAGGSVSSQVSNLLDAVKSIAADHDLPLAKFGDNYLWANKEASLALRSPEQLAAVQARGFTQAEITTIRDYYRAVDYASGEANPSAYYRAQLMQYYLDNWGK